MHMPPLRQDRIFYGDRTEIVKKDENCTIYRMQDDTGEGVMTCHRVFPGIDLIYNDFHMPRCFSAFRPGENIIGIEHCREGRIEWEMENHSYMYLQEGDLQIRTAAHRSSVFGFPLSHYHGITVIIYIEKARETLAGVFGGFPVDLTDLHRKFSACSKPFIIRAEESIEHIFSELYHVPEKIRTGYFKIKVLELLLFISAADFSSASDDRPYFSKKQVETVKSIMEYLTDNLDRRVTLDELSEKFAIPLTPMKLCFRGVYGTSVYTYIRSYRMQAAALMLRKSSQSIAQIAGKVGYDNASKFAAAFRDVMGISPKAYRKSFV